MAVWRMEEEEEVEEEEDDEREEERFCSIHVRDFC